MLEAIHISKAFDGNSFAQFPQDKHRVLSYVWKFSKLWRISVQMVTHFWQFIQSSFLYNIWGVEILDSGL